MTHLWHKFRPFCQHLYLFQHLLHKLKFVNHLKFVVVVVVVIAVTAVVVLVALALVHAVASLAVVVGPVVVDRIYVCLDALVCKGVMYACIRRHADVDLGFWVSRSNPR